MMLCVALLSACTKQAESEAPQIDYKAQFEESDRKIGEFLDQLDNPNTPQEVKVKILCHDSVHDKFHRTLILSGFCLLKIAKISLNSSFFPKPIKR